MRTKHCSAKSEITISGLKHLQTAFICFRLVGKLSTLFN